MKLVSYRILTFTLIAVAVSFGAFAQEPGFARVISARPGNFMQHWFEPREVCRNEAMYAPMYTGSYGFGSPLGFDPFWGRGALGYGQSFGLGFSQQYVGSQRVCRTKKVRFEKPIPNAYQVTYIYQRKAYSTVMSGSPSPWIDLQSLRLPPFDY